MTHCDHIPEWEFEGRYSFTQCALSSVVRAAGLLYLSETDCCILETFTSAGPP